MSEIDYRSKIGTQLEGVIKGGNDNDILKIEVKFVKTRNPPEFELFRNSLTKFADVNEIYKNSKLDIIYVRTVVKEISNIIKIEYVHQIDILPKKQLFSDSESKILELKKNMTFHSLDPEKKYNYVCVLDSGVSGIIDNFVEKRDIGGFIDSSDKDNHGTSVSSLVIFGDQLVDKSIDLIPENKIINFKITEDDDWRHYETLDSLEEAIKNYSKICKIFNCSFGETGSYNFARLARLNYLDKLVFKYNVVIVSSAGNMSESEVYSRLVEYPDYLLQYPVVFPSESLNSLSVGSICCSCKKLNHEIVSKYSKFKLNPFLLDKPDDDIKKFKPEVLAFGGNNSFSTNPRTWEPSNEIPIINANGDLITDMGTSFSAPLVSNYLSNLIYSFEDIYYNTETFRAILFNSGRYSKLNDQPYFIIKNIEDAIKNKILINFEGITSTVHPWDENRKKKFVPSKRITFYLPPEAKSLEIVSVHSSNLDKDDYIREGTRIVIKITKSNGKDLKKVSGIGNINSYTSTCYGLYTFSRNYVGKTKVNVWAESNNVPEQKLTGLKIRFGISIKVNIKENAQSDINNLYDIIRSSINSDKFTITPDKTGVDLIKAKI
ncbi:S8 family serine peptidase [Candidatus Lokiarchaeum ossiferum]|uniref:S8 family serine peptidase n=1 Tax=Candidatus Lokiarchaeum ossiferum TaxID=2951803 RepID=UPI00352C0D77